MRNALVTAGLLATLLLSCTPKQTLPDFASLNNEQRHLPEFALAGMEVAEGLEAGLFASEPMIANPTNISIDHRGRIWLCEGVNYRLSLRPEYQETARAEGDRIVILEDTDGDGKADSKKIFYQGTDIDAALGITVLGNKVIVSCSPNVFVFTDDDGDDRPDHKDTLFTGIQGVDHDHGIHAFSFGPDGRLYFNFGNDSKQLANKYGRSIKDINTGYPIRTGKYPYRQGMAMRCNLDGTGVEVLAHNFRNPYEITVDAFGNLWQSDNDDDGNFATRINYVMEGGNYGFRDEVTGANWRERRVGMHDEIPKRHWHQNDPGVVPNLLYTGAGSPTGICMYEGKLLPAPFQNQMLHSEALKNVVRAYPVSTDGAGYEAGMVNLLKSQNSWFRPSDVAIAPDGSVFVSDWYDPGVGGHRMGDPDRGRIFRVAPRAGQYTVSKLDLSTPEAAVAALATSNNPSFYLAWQKVVNYGEQAEPALLALWQGEDQRLRAKALWLLARLPASTRIYLEKALADSNPDIVITAIRVARQLDPDNLLQHLERISDKAGMRVKAEMAVALRYIGTPAAAALWTELALAYDGVDRWYLEALGIGADIHADVYFNTWLTKGWEQMNQKNARDIIWSIHARESVPLLQEMIKDPARSPEELARYIRAFHFKSHPDKNRLLEELLDVEHPQQAYLRNYTLQQFSPKYIAANTRLQGKIKEILPTIEGSEAWLKVVGELKLREEAPLVMEQFFSGEEHLSQQAGEILFDLKQEKLVEQVFLKLRPKEKNDLINKLGQVGHQGANRLLSGWLNDDKLDPQMNNNIVNVLGNDHNGQKLLLGMLQRKRLKEPLKTTAALKLKGAWDLKLRSEAAKYLTDIKAKRGKPLPPIEQLAQRYGNVDVGKEVFSTYCASCHQVNGEGIVFGPDLSAIGDKLGKSALYTAIIYPSSGINFGFEGHLITLKDSTVYNGYILSENEDEVHLKIMGGSAPKLQRSGIIGMEAMEKSLMTENLHEVMDETELIDLVEYLTTLREAPTQTTD